MNFTFDGKTSQRQPRLLTKFIEYLSALPYGELESGRKALRSIGYTNSGLKSYTSSSDLAPYKFTESNGHVWWGSSETVASIRKDAAEVS
jgi:hypothetical protein